MQTYQVAANVTGTLHKQLSWLRVAPVEENAEKETQSASTFPSPFT